MKKYFNAKEAAKLFKDPEFNKTFLKREVLMSISKALKREHLRFETPYEASGRRVFNYMDAMRGYSNKRNCSYALVDLDLEDLIVLLSEINKKQSQPA